MSGHSGPGGTGTGDMPQRLGKYEIRRALGRGAMGVVYEAFDPVIERRVAIKTVVLDASDDPETAEGLERFKREAQAAGRLTHPNIVGVYDYGETDSLAYIVMEFVEGDTLKSLLDRGERFALADTAALMRALLEGLAYSHAQGVIHRDIKPANVMVTADKRVKLADFGVARIESSSLTQAGTMIGTPAYMSPEQFMGQPIDTRSDIYSTGVLLYQLLTGEKPFEGSLTSIMHKVLNTEPPRPSALAVSATPALDAVVAQAMAKRPDDRFATAAEFAAALDAALSGGAADTPDAADLGEATLVAPRRAAPEASESTQISAAQKPAGRQPDPASAAAKAPTQSSRSNRTPLLAGAGVVALIVAGGGAWLATRGPAPHHAAATQHASSATTPPAASTPGKTAAAKTATASASSPASATSGSQAKGTSGAAQTQSQPAPPSTSPSSGTAAPGTGSAGASATPKPAQSTQASASAPSTTGTSKAASASTGTTRTASMPGSTPAAAGQTKVAANTVPAPPKPPAIPTNAAIRAHVASAVHSVPCALLHGSITGQGQNKSVRLAGFVGSTERSALTSALAAPPVPVSTNIRGFTGPYCGLISAIRPFSGLFQDAGTQPDGQLSLGLANGATKLKAGQLIVIHLGLPDYPAYLQVDYVSSNGSIYPLYPGNAGTKAPLSPGQTLVLGNPKTKGGPRWAVGAPFGRDMIVAIAASKPIGAAPKANATVGRFLPRLRQALATLKQDGARTSTAGFLLDTVSK